MAGALIDNLVCGSEEMKFYLQEKLILDVTELIAKIMEKKNIKKTELAQKLSRSKGYITQLLDGRANMTIRTISDIMWALDSGLIVDACTLDSEETVKSPTQYYQVSDTKPWEFEPSPSSKVTEDKPKDRLAA
jgi:ribosome-binding protein aMBF1 (putative translation factor)